MELEDMSKDDLLFIANAMKDGKTYEQAISELVPVDIRDLVNNFHSMFCKSTHIGEHCCAFYTEKDFTEPAHTMWTDVVKQVISEFMELDNVEEIIADVMAYLWRVENIKVEVEKEVAVGGLAIFNYLLTKSYHSEYP
ncbi:MAG: hypothetical protein BWY21_01127 [Parcubacteria group bacterium ADurb.Bin216]|nr:MAG: hypothetical protein BWY21_01127 [Parcubacteria group bacterium ADurb.Bin216]